MEETSTTKNELSGYALYLAEQNLLDKKVALNALEEAKENNISYVDYLVKQHLLDEPQSASAIANYFGLPLVDIDSFDKDLIPEEYLNIPLVKKKHGLPLIKKNGLLYIATTDPTKESIFEIRFLTGLDTRPLVVEASKLNRLIDELLNSIILSELGDDKSETANVVVNAYKEDTTDLAALDVESAPIVNYVNRVLLDAIDKGASDVHFEHFEESYRIRFRLNGVLYPMTSPPMKLANYILARIKVMSELDITEHRIPQDGRFKLIISRKKSVDFRVSICPTVFGEKIVLRILDSGNTQKGIDSIGMDPIQQDNFLNALNCSQGMVLVTGPTGSGKTVTLYTGLDYLNSTEKNISTVEDPVEIPVLGINQVNVNIKTGLNFSAALRAFLRQDPDIIMVGEIRDLETAEIAVKAAQTGHLVLSTLHTNSAPETITRLMSMGLPPYNLASSLKLIIAQRLVRILCSNCKKEEKVSDNVLLKEGFTEDEIGKFKLYVPGSCDKCTQGFKGRQGIFEVMPISDEMQRIIMDNGKVLDLIEQAKKEKIINLRQSGLKKVKEGLTSLAELDRVFK